MVIFNSYVKLPEGSIFGIWLIIKMVYLPWQKNTTHLYICARGGSKTVPPRPLNRLAGGIGIPIVSMEKKTQNCVTHWMLTQIPHWIYHQFRYFDGKNSFSWLSLRMFGNLNETHFAMAMVKVGLQSTGLISHCLDFRTFYELWYFACPTMAT